AGKVAVFTQTAAGTLATPAPTYSTYDIPAPVDVADLDADGKADVVVLHESSAGSVGVLRQSPGGTLGAEERFATPYGADYNPHELAVGDVNGDGMPDVVFASYTSGLVVLPNATPPPGSTAPGPPTLE